MKGYTYSKRRPFLHATNADHKFREIFAVMDPNIANMRGRIAVGGGISKDRQPLWKPGDRRPHLTRQLLVSARHGYWMSFRGAGLR